mgnify:CR=1 FL=1
MELLIFYPLAGFCVALALGVIFNKSPVGSAISLIGMMLCLAGIFVLQQAHFIAILQVLIYAGAIMVLFLFVIMLLNLGLEDAFPYFRHLQRALSLFMVGLFFVGIFLIMFNEQGILHQPGEKFSAGDIYALGEALFSKYLLPFEVASLLLLVALIGTVYLAKRKI